MGDKKLYFTIDLDWIPGSEQSMGEIFKLIETYNIKPTFFFTGKFAQNYPEILSECVLKKYQIGNHGWAHGKDSNENFGSDVNIDIQRKLLYQSMEVIEKISGIRTNIFRAPRMKISDTTFKVLSELNYQIDSSIASKRFDLGFGSINSLKHFQLPQQPYYIHKPGMNNNILEIPPSAFFLPLNMRLLRTFNFVIINKILNNIEKNTDSIVFYLHPTEFVVANKMEIPKGENMNFYKNCSPKNFEKLEYFIQTVLNRKYEFNYM